MKNQLNARSENGRRQDSLVDLKETIIARRANELSIDERRLRQAVTEAEALAAFTPFPALFLPDLAEEKIQSLAQWQCKQESLRAEHPSISLAV